MDATSTASTTNSLNASNNPSPNVPQVRVVPMVPGMRTRKRSSVRSGNSTAGSINTVGENDDVDSITDNDSMRPLADYSRRPRSHKRQRRTILDAFNSISLKGPAYATTNSTHPTTAGSDSASINMNVQAANSGRNCQAMLSGASYTHHHYPQQEHLLSLHHSDDSNAHENHHHYNDDADSSRAVAEDNEHEDGGYTTSSSLEDEFDDDDDGNGNDEVAYEDDETATLDEQMLSDKELIQKTVERKVMLELVFGPESTFVPPKDPVDRKLHRLINHTIQHATQKVLVSDQPILQPITSPVAEAMEMSEQLPSNNPINGIVVQTNELQDDVSLATTNGGYNSTVSSDSGGGNTNANSNFASMHSSQTDVALDGKKLKAKRKNIRFLFQRSNSLPDNLFTGNQNAVLSNIDTVAEEMDTTDQL